MTNATLETRVKQLEELVSQLNFNKARELRYGQPDIRPALNSDLDAEIAARIAGDAAAAAVPIGGIIAWSGAIVDIPATWQICDGTNGTPNLRDRFIVGAGTTYAVGATGGSTTQANHTVTQPDNHSTHSSVGDHNHETLGAGGGGTFASGTHPPATTGAHTHDAHSAHTGSAVNAHGTNLPPYYALAFIQRMT